MKSKLAIAAALMVSGGLSIYNDFGFGGHWEVGMDILGGYMGTAGLILTVIAIKER